MHLHNGMMDDASFLTLQAVIVQHQSQYRGTDALCM